MSSLTWSFQYLLTSLIMLSMCLAMAAGRRVRVTSGYGLEDRSWSEPTLLPTPGPDVLKKEAPSPLCE